MKKITLLSALFALLFSANSFANESDKELYLSLKKRFEASSKPFDLGRIISTSEDGPWHFSGCAAVDADYENRYNKLPLIALKKSYVKSDGYGPLKPEVRETRIEFTDEFRLRRYVRVGAFFEKNGTLNMDPAAERNASRVSWCDDGTTNKEYALNSYQGLSPDLKSYGIYFRCNSKPLSLYAELRASGEYLIMRTNFPTGPRFTYCWR